MLLKQCKFWLLPFVAMLLTATIAHAVQPWQMPDSSYPWTKGGNRWQPFGPVGFEHDGAPFAPVDAIDFGGRDSTTQGMFFTYERLNWMISRPEIRALGDTNSIAVSTDGRTVFNQSNGRDSAVTSAPFTWGDRLEGGYWDGNSGWSISVMQLGDQAQTRNDSQLAINFINPDVTFLRPNGSPVTITALSGFVDADGDTFDDDLDNDGKAGRYVVVAGAVTSTLTDANDVDYDDMVVFPTIFDTVLTVAHSESSGVELMKMYRFRPFHNGSVLEMFYGARYLELNDMYRVNAVGGFGNDFTNLGTTPDNTGPVRVQTFWDSQAQNNIVGPQIGGRWYSRRGKWNFVLAGRFFAGLNFQDIVQRGQIGGNLPQGVISPTGGTATLLKNAPANLNNSNFEHHARYEEFSPTTELRIESTYALSKAVSLKVGWTGIYSAGIARGANMVLYRVPDLGIAGNNRENYFSTGLNFGVEINR